MKQQARAPQTRPFGAEAFASQDGTVLRWLGMAGFLINARGTTVMIDPLLGGFDMPVMIDFPITPETVPRLDAVLITHSDNDHFSVPTCRQLAPVTTAFHSTRYVDTLMRAQNLPSTGHDIGDRFSVGQIDVTVTPADHAWQNDVPGAADRTFRPEDCCGFWLATPDGIVWAPGDSRLIPDHHLHMPTPDAMLFDFSDSEWHFGLAGSHHHGERVPGHAAAAAPLGLRRRARLSTVQRRPPLPAGPGRQPGPDRRPGAGPTVRPSALSHVTTAAARNPVAARGRKVNS